MNIQKIKKKGFFLIFTILALFCLVNCGKDNDSPIEENNSKESISNENTSKELEALKKPIDLSALTFNEAQQKLIDIHIADFPKNTEVVEGKNVIDEKLDSVIQHYYRKTKNGESTGGGFKEIYFKKGTKEGFTGKIIHSDFYTSSYIEEYIKDGVAVLRISYGNGEKYRGDALLMGGGIEKYPGSENSLKILDYLNVSDDKKNQISYDFKSDFINENYAKENGITLDDHKQCPILVITEEMNGIVIKNTYYYYDFSTGKFVTKYEEILPENLEFAKTSEIIYKDK